MSDEKTNQTLPAPKPVVVGTPKFQPGTVVRYDNPPLHIVSRVVFAKFTENHALGDKCEWQYMIEGNPQGLIPERVLSKA